MQHSHHNALSTRAPRTFTEVLLEPRTLAVREEHRNNDRRRGQHADNGVHGSGRAGVLFRATHLLVLVRVCSVNAALRRLQSVFNAIDDVSFEGLARLQPPR
jgi:hypothetical protein